MRLPRVEALLYTTLFRYVQDRVLGRVLIRVQGRVQFSPITSGMGPGGNAAFIRKDLDRQPIGATLNLPQEAP